MDEKSGQSIRLSTSGKFGVKRQRLWMLVGTILSTANASPLRHMPLSSDNGLPSAVFRFGSTDKNEIPISCHIDSSAAMNIANLLIHMWIITISPEIVHIYEHHSDVNPFQPILLYCAIPTADAALDKNKLTAVITYYTRYVDCDGNKLKLSFGIAESIAVNAIIGLPTIWEWKLVLDVDANRASSKLLDVYFDLNFQRASSGLPTAVTFTASDFVRPPRETQSGVAVVYNIAAAKDTSPNLTSAFL